MTRMSGGSSVGLAPSPIPNTKDEKSMAKTRRHSDVVIVGSGPAGLLSAIMMAQQSELHPHNSGGNGRPGLHVARPRIIVYDRLPPPPPPDDPAYAVDRARYYLLGLGHRGHATLRHYVVWDEVEVALVAVLGRRDWQLGKTAENDGTVRMSDKAVTSRVLPHDKLVSVLKGVIEVRFGGVMELR